MRLHHVQLAIPPNSQETARTFYAGVLLLTELPKPANLAKRGGLWFEPGLHLGVEEDFRPARKAHPALEVDDLQALRQRCEEAGFPPLDDEPLPGYDRFYVYDPFGNRLELLQVRRRPW